MRTKRTPYSFMKTGMVSGSGSNFVFCAEGGCQVHLEVCRRRKLRACRKCRYATGQLSLFDIKKKKRPKRGGGQFV